MLYELVLNLQYLEQKIVNRWNYNSNEIGVSDRGAFGLVQALGLFVTGDPEAFPVGSMGAAIQAVLNSQTIFVQVYAKNIYQPTDFYDNAFVEGVVGGVSGTGLSPVMALGFNSSRKRTDIRRGQKRFGGLATSFEGNGGAVSAAGITAGNTLATRMGEQVDYDNAGTIIQYTPVIVSKKKVVDEEDKVTYVYYPTLAEQLTHLAVSPTWFLKPDLRTQGSRQYGRGQ